VLAELASVLSTPEASMPDETRRRSSSSRNSKETATPAIGECDQPDTATTLHATAPAAATKTSHDSERKRECLLKSYSSSGKGPQASQKVVMRSFLGTLLAHARLAHVASSHNYFGGHQFPF